jgi:hypothetical protein
MLFELQIISNSLQRNLLEYLQSDQILELYHATTVETAISWLKGGVHGSHYQSKIYWNAGKEHKGIYVTPNLDRAKAMLERHYNFGDSCIIVFRVLAKEVEPSIIEESEGFENSFNPDLSHSLDEFKEALLTGQLKRKDIKDIIYNNSSFSRKDFYDLKS